tara:strand:- start:473 stop:655 length:183 start_codon:yes stop_codon:yes gene_type:complete
MFANGSKVVFKKTGSGMLDGQFGTVVGTYAEDFVIVLFDTHPIGFDPAIVITKHCLEIRG